MARTSGATDTSREGSQKKGKGKSKAEKQAATALLPGASTLDQEAQRILSKREIQKRAVEFLSGLDYTKSLYARLLMGQAPHMETLLHHYAFGKPPEKIQVNTNPLKLLLTRGRPGEFDPVAAARPIGARSTLADNAPALPEPAAATAEVDDGPVLEIIEDV